MLSSNTPTSNHDPAYEIVAVAPSDATDIKTDGSPCRGLLVGQSGNATVIDAKGNTVANVPLQQGYNPIRVRRVKSTGLVAANIFALY
jgi:hypothetical protein